MSATPDLKGSSFTLSVLHLPDNEITKSIDFLKQKVSQAPAFFSAAPVVVNVSQVSEDIDYDSLKKGIYAAGMVPVGVTGTKDKRSSNRVSDAGLAVMTASKSPNNAPATVAPTKIVRHQVRSGQQIYAKNSDLIVLNHVSAGAEVIADGSIQIYGSLRGRAIAGASGLQEATIICKDLQAELVSIAGNYWLSDQISSEYWKKKVILSYSNDTLHFELLTI